MKAHIAEAKQGLRKVETEIMVATGVETTQPDAAADAAAHVHFGQLMSAFHQSAAANIADAEVCPSSNDYCVLASSCTSEECTKYSCCFKSRRGSVIPKRRTNDSLGLNSIYEITNSVTFKEQSPLVKVRYWKGTRCPRHRPDDDRYKILSG